MRSFQLSRKTDGNIIPPQIVDNELCQYLGVPADTDNYYCGWYDSIGWGLTCGASFQDLRESAGKKLERQPERAEYFGKIFQILDYLDENFTANAVEE